MPFTQVNVNALGGVMPSPPNRVMETRDRAMLGARPRCELLGEAVHRPFVPPAHNGTN